VNRDSIISAEKISTDPELYVDCFLTEQIPVHEWVQILKERPDVKRCFERRMKDRYRKNRK
jgi:hypothetical protein